MIVDLERKWVGKGACRGKDAELFFPDHGVHALQNPTAKLQEAWNKAKQICERCPVCQECARDSLGETEGVWGGLDPAERQLLRITNGQRIRNLEGQEKEDYAFMAWSLYNERNYGWQDVGRILGITYRCAQYLVQWHQDAMAQQPEATQEVAEVASVAVRPAWPTERPTSGDAWVRYGRRVVRGHYLGQTEDDQWFLMKVPLSREDSTAWFKAEDVRFVRKVTRTLRKRVGETSRIYGTTISPRNKDHAKVG